MRGWRSAALLLAWWAGTASAADPERGARLFATSPAPGLLACAECHSEDPLVNNFGNIFVGRNAAPLIVRAVLSNTGGMVVFREWYDDAALADIAAYLGNSPGRVDFGTQPLGAASGPRSVAVRASSKLGVDGLQLTAEGDFAIAGSDCGAALAARASCEVQVVFRPQAGGLRSGALQIAHSGLPTPARVVLVGQGLDRPPAQARVLPATLNFPAPGSTRRMALLNDSVEPLRLSAVAMSSSAFRVEGGSCAAGQVLAGGQSCMLVLRWQTAAQPSAVLSLVHDGVGGRSEVALAGASGAARPAAVFSVASVDFGQVEPGRVSATQDLWLFNLGAADLRLGALRAPQPDFEIVGGSCGAGVTLAPAAACRVQLRWRPARAGLATAELRATIQGADEPLRLPLAGRTQGAAGLPSIAPAWLPLQAAIGARSAAGRAWVVNRGSAPVRLAAPVFEGDAAADFELAAGGTCGVGQVLAPQAACALAVSYRPSTAGRANARLRLAHDGAGGAVLLALAGTTASLPWLDRAGLDFPSGAAATEVQTVTVSARGDEPLRLARIDRVGDDATDFRLGGSCAIGRELATGSSCTVEVRFVPSGPGWRSATLALGMDNGGTALVSLSGGLAPRAVDEPAAASLQWRADGGKAAWAITAVGELAAATLRLHNGSAAAVTLQALGVAGAAAAEYSVDATSECRTGAVLAPGASCAARLNFHPTGAGPRRATLTAWLAGRDPVSTSLAATGLAPALGVAVASPAELRFPAALTGADAAQSATLVNDGPGPLTVQPAVLQGGGFVTLPAPADEVCGGEGWALLPGESCRVGINWTGGAAAQLGGRWSVLAGEQAVGVTMAVSEDPAETPNVGGGAVSLGTGNALSDLLLLFVIAVVVGRALRRDATESADA